MSKYSAKWPDADGIITFSEQENETWHQLITRQMDIIDNYACLEFIDGLQQLQLPTDRVPQPSDLNKPLQQTGWEMVPVHGTVGPTQFFSMLSMRQFPVANFIRIPEELDYLQQPDIFHEYFGHGPLLMLPAYADFIQWYGALGTRIPNKLRPVLSRLFWYTIEFGLIKTPAGLRIYGGGILSSYQETLFAIDSGEAKRLPYDIATILDTTYDYTNIQPHYFFIDNWDMLYQIQQSEDLINALNKVDPDEQLPFDIC